MTKTLDGKVALITGAARGIDSGPMLFEGLRLVIPFAEFPSGRCASREPPECTWR